ncbi:hypothetical protein PIB30_048735 [Stylosanthes scabra]|uniref:Uncharacterized protein n=1 Tax=Stylosanthes scabra TaxID=79078 RepID=A0ABU6YEH6_9FABA|nr:hypothetical protein [Stylosanthes scabra]
MDDGRGRRVPEVMISVRGGSGGMRVRVRRRSAGATEDLLADEVDAEGDNGDTEAWEGVAELIGEHWVLPPLVPPPKEFCCFLRSILLSPELSLSSSATLLRDSIFPHLAAVLVLPSSQFT